MGRRMFGGGEGPWDQTWTGWWGDEPPFHAPVFVLTHHSRPPLSLGGGTMLLGGGDRLLEGVGDPPLEPVEVVASPTVTHVKYRIRR